jgi:hypothetical protein
LQVTIAVADGLAVSPEYISNLAIKKRNHTASLCGFGGGWGAANGVLDDGASGWCRLHQITFRALIKNTPSTSSFLILTLYPEIPYMYENISWDIK